jgi:hypothetical protein
MTLLFSHSGYKSKGLNSLEICNYMTIEKYVSGMRADLNKQARNFGNKIYDGLGDKLASDVDLKKGAKKGIAVLTLLVGVGLNSGCVTPQGRQFGQSLVKRSIYSTVDQDARNRSDRINAARQEYRIQANVPSIKMYMWDDENGDRDPVASELLGKISGSVKINIGKLGLYADSFKNGKARYILKNSTGDVFYDFFDESIFICPNASLPNGTYILTAEQNNETLSRKFKIVGSSVE